jgi:outer membrane lipoprotein-sorting protein
LFFSAAAAEPGVMSLWRKNYSGAGAVSAVFDMVTYWSVREKEEKKAGELLIAPGERFRVTLGREVFVSDGKTYWQYNERNSQVVIRKHSDIDVSTLPSKMLSSFLSGRVFTEGKRGGGTVELSWAGKGADDGYTAIVAIVDEKGGVIKVLKLTDANDNIHTYTFKKTTFDKPPKDDVFRFNPPRGVEVIDMREQ